MQAVWDLRRALDATGHNIKISADEWGLGSVAANLTIVVFAVAAAAVGAGADVVGGVVISFVSFVVDVCVCVGLKSHDSDQACYVHATCILHQPHLAGGGGGKGGGLHSHVDLGRRCMCMCTC